jgi:hypothetical protein
MYNIRLFKVDKEAAMMKYLRLKSEMRNPPLDHNGNILPPKNFKKYPPKEKSTIFEGALTNFNIQSANFNKSNYNYVSNERSKSQIIS